MVNYEDIEDALDTELLIELKKKFGKVVVNVKLSPNKNKKSYELEIVLLDLVQINHTLEYGIDYEYINVLEYLENKYGLTYDRKVSDSPVSSFIYTNLTNDKVIDMLTLCKLSTK